METCTRRIEFDAGHRVPQHNGQCRRPHGHHYVVEATIRGDVADDGMIIDFGVLKDLLMKHVHDVLDHRFICAADDHPLITALDTVSPECVVTLPYAPTAENLATWAATVLDGVLPVNLPLVHVRVSETPNCWADWWRT